MRLTVMLTSTASTDIPSWVNVLTMLVGSIGFPIVGCCAMFWYMVKQSRDHKEEIGKLSDVIQKNTDAIEILTDRITRQ